MIENQTSMSDLGVLEKIDTSKLKSKKSIGNTQLKSKFRPNSQTERSVFQDFSSTPLISQDNENSQQLLSKGSEIALKPSQHHFQIRPKLSRQDGRTNSAFEPADDESFSPQSAVTSLYTSGTKSDEGNDDSGRIEVHEMSEKNFTPKGEKRRNRSKKQDAVAESSDFPLEATESSSQHEQAAECTDDKILGIVVHSANRLTCSIPFFLTHPLVKVHILEASTGKYFKKSRRNRPATSFYEGKNLDRILPIMTQPCVIQPKNSSPDWDELLIFNENFSYFIQSEPIALILFEIMDFLSPSSSNFNAKTEEKGWYPLAWAFLKPRGANGRLNVGHKVRLQLYFAPPPSLFFMASKRKTPHVYEWFNGARSKHPGSLYVSFKSITPPKDVQPALRSMLPMQQESGVSGNEEFHKENQRISSNKSLNLPVMSPPKTLSAGLTQWNRLTGQACRIPTQQLLSLSVAEKGNFRVRFSTDGCLLACASCSTSGFNINIYEITSGLELGQLKGHAGLIYDLDWSPKGRILLSASADSTARVWQPATSLYSTCILPHPSYVYSAKFHPDPDSNIAVTAGYDCLIRIWIVPPLGVSKGRLQLLQELEGHQAAINAICWGLTYVLYSGDTVGCVKVWKQEADETDFYYVLDIDEKSIKGQVINSLGIIPGSKKLLVETRNGCVRSIHLQKHLLTRVYGDKTLGADSFFGRSCLSPCGNLLFTLSSSNLNNYKHIVVWNTLTGAQVHEYDDLLLNGANISCLDFHPLDNMLAVCGYGKECAVLVYGLGPRGPLKPLPAIPYSSVESPAQYSSSMSLQRDGEKEKEDGRLRLQRVLRKLDTVLTVTASSLDTP